MMDCERKNPSLPGSGKTIEEGEYFVKNDVTDALFSLLKETAPNRKNNSNQNTNNNNCSNKMSTI